MNQYLLRLGSSHELQIFSHIIEFELKRNNSIQLNSFTSFAKIFLVSGGPTNNGGLVFEWFAKQFGDFSRPFDLEFSMESLINEASKPAISNYHRQCTTIIHTSKAIL
jgi:sugar (pentulose or hexulose) kinase